jgi:hypothetical protein
MINWGALGVVSLVSLAGGVVVVVLVALALVGLSAREPVSETADINAEFGADGTEPVGRATGPAMSPAAGTALAAVCLLAAAAIVVYGLALIVFH